MLFPAFKNRPDKDPNIGLVEKFAYGLGDFASQLVYTPVSMLFIYYCTEYVDVNIAVVASIMMISRIFDGFSDLMVGYLVERTNSPYGKSRTWILRTMIPFFLCGTAMFAVPAGASDLVKYIYIFIVYNLTITCAYTAINLSYGTLSVAMTTDSYQRSVLVIFRMLSATVGGTLVMLCALPMVKFFGNDQMAWTITMGAFSALASLSFFVTFYFCHERVVSEPVKADTKETIQAIKNIFKNKYWVYLTIAMLFICAADLVGGSSSTYYVKYYLGDETLIGPFSTVANTCKVIGMLTVVPFALKKWGKRNALLMAAILMAAANLTRTVDPYSIQLNYVLNGICGFCAGFTYTTLFAMIPDCVEYSEYRDHERHEGLVYAGVSFATKLAAGLGGLIASIVMSMGGYENGAAVQTESSMTAILWANTVVPPIMYGVAIFALFFYKLDKIYDNVIQELNLRRAKKAAEESTVDIKAQAKVAD